MDKYEIKAIAHMESDFPEKFGIPRQAGIVEQLQGRIVFEPEYRDMEAFRGIEEFSHIWVIWQFSENLRQGWSPTVRPPRLGGNERRGVFATRSPFRPNSLGLSSLRLLRLEKDRSLGPVLHVAGADLMDGTPIFDIKPYVPYADCHETASGGFAPDSGKRLEVIIPQDIEELFPAEKLSALTGVLANDPRPRYHHSPDRVYNMDFASWRISFTAGEDCVRVTAAKKL